MFALRLKFKNVFIEFLLYQIIDATTETHIYQVRLTEALISKLEFQKGKDAEIAWIDGQINIRNKMMDASTMEVDDQIEITDDSNILTLEPVKSTDVATDVSHNCVFINELKLSDFKQILAKHNISSEFSGGVLWCGNGTITLKRVFKCCILCCGLLFIQQGPERCKKCIRHKNYCFSIVPGLYFRHSIST